MSITTAANNTLSDFLLQSKTASELGNVSGASGSFVPYLDIYVFDSKNMSKVGRGILAHGSSLQQLQQSVSNERL